MDDVTEHEAIRETQQSFGRGPARRAASLAPRDELLTLIQTINPNLLPEDDTFLVVINIADTKKYDEIIHNFGYSFVDELLNIRLRSLEFLTTRTKLYDVGFWSVGFLLQPQTYAGLDLFIDRTVVAYRTFLRRLVEKLNEPVICRGIPISIKSGVGVCDIKKGLGSAQDLLQGTFLAGQVNSQLSTTWHFCNYDLAADNRRAFAIISDVNQALRTSGQLELCYQPRTVVASGQCIGAEALLRWRHPTLGQITPNEFIPLVEQTGLIRELTDWVLTHAIAQAATWKKLGMELKVSVNISVSNLEEEDFVDRIIGLLRKAELKPGYLELEFSESRPFSDVGLAMERLRALRNIGVNIAIDDFGTGRNSFTYLQTIPANIMKIDQRLICSLKDDLQKQNVVKSMIAMAHRIGMTVVGEGVETMELLEVLYAWGCDHAQGYYINRPMYADEFLTWHNAQTQ
jgi:EAL domain-containing protein (putative c-di-GMP-specific phosphodiesterase class I)